MRITIVATGLLLGLLPAKGAEPSATVQRAAYCSAVLQYRLDTYVPNAPDAPDNVCRGWWQKDYASIEACTAVLERNTLKSTQLQLKRYNDYLKLELGQLMIVNGGDVQATYIRVAFIKRKGRSDAIALKVAPISHHVQQCEKKCDTEFRCLIDCISEQQPTDASVLRCALLPDELPY